MTAGLAIADAIAWHVFKLNLTPRTALTVQAEPGDRVLHVTPLLDADTQPRLARGGTLSWYDASAAFDTTGEPRYNIAAVSSDGTQITLDSAAGLVAQHPVGTIVSSNCYGRRPSDPAACLNAGDPLIYLGAARKRTRPAEVMRKAQPVYSVQLRYHRQLFRSPNVDANIWVMEQEEITIGHLETIEERLLTNDQLRTDTTTAVARCLGVHGSTAADLIVWDIDRFEVETDTWQFFALMDITVSAEMVNRRG